MIELGCGSGATAAALSDWPVTRCWASTRRGRWSSSPARRAPAARFRVGTWVDAPIPECDAVLAIGEVLGYVGSARAPRPSFATCSGASARRFAPAGSSSSTWRLLGECPPARTRRSGSATTGRSSTRPRRTARAASFSAASRRSGSIAGGATYRRTEEVHRLRLWRPGEIEEMLRDARFKVQTRRGYGPRSFAPGHRVFVARA